MTELIHDRRDALPHGIYRLQPRRCTDCGAWPVVADGRYWCITCHPDYHGAKPMVTLTAGGKPAPPKPNPLDPATLLRRWESTITTMLNYARRYHELDALAAKRRAWCDANPFHDLHDERHAAMWLTVQERNETGAQMMDACEALSRLQQQMPERMVDGLGALLGHPLWPYAGQKWAMALRRLPKGEPIDLFDVASWVVMEWRSESEAQEAA